MIDTLLYDLDGTLLQTDVDPYVTNAVGAAFAEMGIQCPSREWINKFWFSYTRHDMLHAIFDGRTGDFWNAFREHSNPDVRRQHMRPYNDVDVLRQQVEGGYKVGIVTGASPRTLDMELDMLGRDNFHAVVHTFPASGVPYKPDTAGMYKCLELLGSGPEHALYVGNADEDYEMALRAGVPFVLIDRKEYDISGIPGRRIESLYELGSISL